MAVKMERDNARKVLIAVPNTEGPTSKQQALQ